MTTVTYAVEPVEPAVVSRRALWAGRVLSGLAVLFLTPAGSC
jgi:hypothetical protein